jgi:hypothetical protein
MTTTLQRREPRRHEGDETGDLLRVEFEGASMVMRIGITTSTMTSQ